MSNDTAIRDPRVGSVVQDRYRILQRLAAGGMGVVYRGERVGLGRAVAVKFLHPWVAEDASFKLRFELEAQAMGRLNHPSCVSVIDWGIDGDAPFLVMDYVAGPTLRLVLREGRLAPRRALELIRQVLAGLAHAHAQGVVHRDLKPDNLVLTEVDGLGELVRILDFGLAKLKDAATGLSMGLVLGTPNYMPPEQVRADAVDERSDLYAVGAMLFELLTGSAPFSAGASSEILRRQLHEAPPRLASAVPGAGFSEALESVVARALAKSPEARFQTAAAFAKALETTPEAGAASPDADWRERGLVASDAREVSEARGDVVSVDEAAVSEASRADFAPLAPTQVSRSSSPVPVGPELEVPAAQSPLNETPSSSEQVGSGDAANGAGPMSTRSMRKSPPAQPEVEAAAAGSSASDDNPAGSSEAARTRGSAGSFKRVLAAGAAVALVVAGIGLSRGRDSSAPSATLPQPSAPEAQAELIARPVVPPIEEPPPEDSLEPQISDPGEVPEESATANDEAARALASIARLAKNGQRDRALRSLGAYRKQHPDSAPAARLEGQINFAHLRWDDGLEAYGAAIRLDPTLREDRALIADLIGCLVSDSAHRKCGRFLVKQVGAPALPQLEEAASASRYANVQHRARRLISAGGFTAR